MTQVEAKALSTGETTKEEAAKETTNTTETSAEETANKPVETPENATKLEGSIIRQVEYYFGDANLARDKFLQEETTKDDGWVPLDVLLTFKRLKALSEDKKVIADAVEKSDEVLVEISEDREKLRRHPGRPLPEQNKETRKEINARTMYVKGFAPEDGTDMNELIEFFEPYDKVTNIVMRKHYDDNTNKHFFKGSVFVTFATKEQCVEFLKKEKLDYNGKELVRKMQDDYFKEKKAERKKKDKNKKVDKLDDSHLLRGACVHLDGIGKETSRETIKETILKLDESLKVAFID